MAEIIWSPQAIEDVESIRDYISRDSQHFGALVAQRIIEAVERLASFPQSGRIVPEFGDPNLREVLWRDYRIVYHTGRTTVEVVSVPWCATLHRWFVASVRGVRQRMGHGAANIVLHPPSAAGP